VTTATLTAPDLFTAGCRSIAQALSLMTRWQWQCIDPEDECHVMRTLRSTQPVVSADGSVTIHPEIVIRKENGARLRLSGFYPHPIDSHRVAQLRSAIGVSAERGAYVIAREIHRRLWSAYLGGLKLAVEKFTDARDEEKRRDDLREDLCSLSPRFTPSSHQADSLHISQREEQGWGTVTLSGDGESLCLDLRYLPLEQARRILQIIAEEEE
jgi:hypothetical protein